ncbi:MAG: NBR1-Ig-like domain-containing protein [Anaerolineae bacterium]|nr:NBR1-Ig-like domain-containing protein [Anaerolineae bacterium]
MKKQISIVLIGLAASFVLAACGRSEPTAEETPDIAASVAALSSTDVSVKLTEIKLAEDSTTPEPNLTPSPTVISTATKGAVQVTPAATNFTSSKVCLEAAMASETIPDGTVMEAGEHFEKTWWLTNTGTCAWTDEFSLVFNRGYKLGAVERSPFPGYVAPGQSIPLTLSMTAPGVPGTYTSFWEMENGSGVRFGVGVDGGVPFWVQIVVPGEPPPSKARDLLPKSSGSVRADGVVKFEMKAGDNGATLGRQVFTTYSFGNLSTEATVTGLILDLDQGYRKTGDPFGGLGCLNVYLDEYGTLDASDYTTGYPGVALWTFCNEDELGSASRRAGGPAAIQAVQDALYSGSGQLQLRFQFENETDGDNKTDEFFFAAYLRILWVLLP